jgi:hypothetical protein
MHLTVLLRFGLKPKFFNEQFKTTSQTPMLKFPLPVTVPENGPLAGAAISLANRQSIGPLQSDYCVCSRSDHFSPVTGSSSGY